MTDNPWLANAPQACRCPGRPCAGVRTVPTQRLSTATVTRPPTFRRRSGTADAAVDGRRSRRSGRCRPTLPGHPDASPTICRSTISTGVETPRHPSRTRQPRRWRRRRRSSSQRQPIRPTMSTPRLVRSTTAAASAEPEAATPTARAAVCAAIPRRATVAADLPGDRPRCRGRGIVTGRATPPAPAFRSRCVDRPHPLPVRGGQPPTQRQPRQLAPAQPAPPPAPPPMRATDAAAAAASRPRRAACAAPVSPAMPPTAIASSPPARRSPRQPADLRPQPAPAARQPHLVAAPATDAPASGRPRSPAAPTRSRWPALAGSRVCRRRRSRRTRSGGTDDPPSTILSHVPTISDARSVARHDRVDRRRASPEVTR